MAELVKSQPSGAVDGWSTLTVVIVNWNSGRFLRSCINSIPDKAGGLNVNLVVIDNASRDGSAKFLEIGPSKVHFIQSGKNYGFGRANNMAQPHVRPGCVLFLNPDTELREHALAQMVGWLETHPWVGAVGCKMVFSDGEVADQNLQWFPTPLTEFVGLAFLPYGIVRRLKGILPWNDPLRSGYVRKLYGGCLMVRTSVLDKIGWFDERFFMYAEDVDLSRRISEAGWRLYYLSEAEIIHAVGGSTIEAGSNFSILMGCESMSKLIDKYYGPAAATRYRWGVAAAAIIRLCLLTMLQWVSLAIPTAKRPNLTERIQNWKLRLQWAGHRRQAFIPH
jgi:N-acetylglucosaminyl-diphospho-decaprenol L-rhamnosyltransferase